MLHSGEIDRCLKIEKSTFPFELEFVAPQFACCTEIPGLVGTVDVVSSIV